MGAVFNNLKDLEASFGRKQGRLAEGGSVTVNELLDRYKAGIEEKLEEYKDIEEKEEVVKAERKRIQSEVEAIQESEGSTDGSPLVVFNAYNRLSYLDEKAFDYQARLRDISSFIKHSVEIARVLEDEVARYSELDK